MKRWISPPVQLFLWLGGIACLCAAAWNMWQLRQVTLAQHSSPEVKVSIPEASALKVPGIGGYRKVVEAPLFWAAREVPKKVVAVPKPIPKPPPPVVVKPPEPKVLEVLLNPPVGRLVGIVDLGEKKYALIRNATENKSLYKGDTWEGWRVDSIDRSKIVLSAGKQRSEIPLIGDFSAPAPNKQMLATKQRQQQRKQHRDRQEQAKQLQQRQQALKAAIGEGAAAGAGANGQQPQSPQEQLKQMLNGGTARSSQPAKPVAPVLSIKEALEARQRLMASRWGKNKK